VFGGRPLARNNLLEPFLNGDRTLCWWAGSQCQSYPIPVTDARRSTRMLITGGSRLHKCFHEAGHIEIALLSGAKVTFAEVPLVGDARTSVTHKPDLSTKKPIACGGYSVELILFEQGKLVGANRIAMAEVAFQQQAMGHARLDKFPFYLTKNRGADGIWPDALFQPNPDDTWPPESDGPFIEYARQHIVPLLRPRMFVIGALASSLTSGSLDESEIDDIRKDFPS
jgi:hypothetical protein